MLILRISEICSIVSLLIEPVLGSSINLNIRGSDLKANFDEGRLLDLEELSGLI
jgi:hypothetical protein